MKDPQAIARACADVLWANDHASQKLGIEIKSISPGGAELTMTVANDMTNGHGTCHGGFLFSLADSAFAFSCNTYDQCCVAQHCTISYLAPAHTGDKLHAVAHEVSRKGRNGIYDIRISNQKHETIVEFLGYSRTIPGSLLSQDKPSE